jgi:peroxiredoxin
MSIILTVLCIHTLPPYATYGRSDPVHPSPLCQPFEGRIIPEILDRERRGGSRVAAEVGEKAPDFTLPSDDWENQVSLEEARRDGPVVLFFYPGDWSSVCTDQMGQLQQEIGRFEEKGVRILGISVDSPWSHKAWAEERGIEFSLLSDFGREVVEEYGVKHEAGFPERSYFVIDREGVVRAKKVEDSPDDQPEVDDVLEDLEKAL